MPHLFRIFGVLLLLVGLWWIRSFLGAKYLPTAETEEQAKAEITSALDREDYVTAVSLADRGLQIAPLNWLLYYQRGLAEVALSSRQLTIRDFGIAKYLYLLWPELYLREGEVWFNEGEIDRESRCFTAGRFIRCRSIRGTSGHVH